MARPFSFQVFPGFWGFDSKAVQKRCKGVHCVDLGESFPTSIDPNSNEYLLATIGYLIPGSLLFFLFFEKDCTTLVGRLLACFDTTENGPPNVWRHGGSRAGSRATRPARRRPTSSRTVRDLRAELADLRLRQFMSGLQMKMRVELELRTYLNLRA